MINLNLKNISLIKIVYIFNLLLLTTFIFYSFFNIKITSSPIINTITPSSGPTTGGNTITINGTGFSNFNANQVDTSFITGSSANSGIKKIGFQSDGKIIIAGIFTSFDGTTSNRIARLNSDGSLDTTFNLGGSGANAEISTFAIQNDDKIIIGGHFTNYNGVNINYFTRLNADGTLDSGFTSGNPTGNIHAINIQSDGKIIITGAFTMYQFVSRNKIARVNSNGSLDTTFNPGTGPAGVLPDILAASILSDGKIIIAGYFTSYNGTARNRIARINSNGSLDTTFIIGTGFNNVVFDIKVQSDGKILVGGDFTFFAGTSRNRIARLNSSGSLDTTFDPGTGFDLNLLHLNIQSDGKILVGGNFTSYNGISRNRIVKININGSLDSDFNVSVDSVIYSSLFQGEKIIIGGYFTTVNSSAVSYIARLGGIKNIEVNIGTNSCTSVNFISSTEINCIVPAGTVGFKDVTVINADNSSYTLINGYEYLASGNLGASGNTTVNLNITSGTLNMYAGDAINNNDLCINTNGSGNYVQDDGTTQTAVTCDASESSVTLSGVSVASTRQNTTTTINDILFEDLSGSENNIYAVSATFGNLVNGSGGQDITLGSNPDQLADDTDTDASSNTGDEGKIFCSIDPSIGNVDGIAPEASRDVTNEGYLNKASKTSGIISNATSASIFNTTQDVVPGRYDIDSVSYKCRIPAYADAGTYSQTITFTVVAS